MTALVLVVALLLYRRCSAHGLSLLWRGALVGLCLLPLLSIVTPPIPILPAHADVPAVTVAAMPVDVSEMVAAESIAPAVAVLESEAAAVKSGTAVTVVESGKIPWLAIVWLAGVVFVLSRWLLAVIRVRSLWRAGRAIDSTGWDLDPGVRLRISERVSLPMIWGSRRPAILLPSDAEEWDAETRRSVLAHELAHARSGDSRFLMIAQLATAMHWANPLVWIIGRLLRDAQERLADDSVLATGQEAGQYAALLLDFAKRCTRPAPLAVSAMANPSRVGKRIERVLNDGQARGRLGAVACCCGALVILCATTIVAAAAAKKVDGKQVEPEPAANDRGEANRAKLKSIIIPKIDFDETKFEDAIAFLQAQMKLHDPDKKGVPLRIVGDVKETAPLTLQLSQIPALPAMQFASQIAGLEFIVKSTGVEIGVGVAEGLESRTFRVPRKLAAKIEAAGGAEAYWSKLGAEFPDGSTIGEPTEKGGDMPVGHNPSANLKLMEKHIAAALKSGDTPTRSWLEVKVESLILPQVEFKGATLQEAIDFLRLQARAHDPAEDPRHRGVNILVSLGKKPADEVLKKTIDLSLKNASLKTVVEAVAKQTGMAVNIDPLAVVFVPKAE